MNLDLRLRGIISTILYLGIILIITTDFDLLIFPIALGVAFIISFFKFYRKEKEKDKIKELKNRFLIMKENVETNEKDQEVIEHFNRLEKKLDLIITEVDEDYVLKKMEVDTAVLSQADILEEKRVLFKKKLEENTVTLIDLMDYEEVKLIQFLHLKNRLYYNYFIALEVIILCITITLAFLTYFFFLSMFIIWFALFFLVFRDVQYTNELIFKKGYLRYKIVRKKLNYYKIQFKFLLNNSLIKHDIKEFDDFDEENSLLERKIDDYLNAIPPYYSYIKKIELIGIVGIILSVIFIFFQGYINGLPDLINIDFFEMSYLVIFIYVIIVSPILVKQREYKEKQMFKTIYKKIDVNFRIIRDIQEFLVMHNTHLI